MLQPSEMKNKAAVAASIAKAQQHFGEDAQALAASITRPIMESILHTYIERYRKAKTAAVAIPCTACGGDGMFKFYNGNTGSCYRCIGKGHQNSDDIARNAVWDRTNRPQVHMTPASDCPLLEDGKDYNEVITDTADDTVF